MNEYNNEIIKEIEGILKDILNWKSSKIYYYYYC